MRSCFIRASKRFRNNWSIGTQIFPVLGRDRFLYESETSRLCRVDSASSKNLAYCFFFFCRRQTPYPLFLVEKPPPLDQAELSASRASTNLPTHYFPGALEIPSPLFAENIAKLFYKKPRSKAQSLERSGRTCRRFPLFHWAFRQLPKLADQKIKRASSD